MIDPLPAAPPFLRGAVQPLADRFDLQTLPLHVHEIIFAFAFYYVLGRYVAPSLSTRVFPEIYPQLPLRTKVNWNVRFVSQIQSSFICGCAFWVLSVDKDRELLGSTGRIWGYSGATGMIQAFAAGYFAWDVVVSTQYFSILGLGSLAHGISALIIVSLGFRPFANYYGVAFILYELSTPFLNFHWFFDKCNMTSSRIQLYNGIVLLIVFFGCRLAWGTYLSVQIYRDIWNVRGSLDGHGMPLAGSELFSAHELEGTRLYNTSSLPPWLVLVYLGSNTLLTLLNGYWFWLMLQAGSKRFSSKKHSEPKPRDKIQ